MASLHSEYKGNTEKYKDVFCRLNVSFSVVSIHVYSRVSYNHTKWKHMTCIEGQYYIVKLGYFDINLNVQHVNGITPFLSFFGKNRVFICTVVRYKYCRVGLE